MARKKITFDCPTKCLKFLMSGRRLFLKEDDCGFICYDESLSDIVHYFEAYNSSVCSTSLKSLLHSEYWYEQAPWEVQGQSWEYDIPLLDGKAVYVCESKISSDEYRCSEDGDVYIFSHEPKPLIVGKNVKLIEWEDECYVVMMEKYNEC